MQKVARNEKSCQKVAKQLVESPSRHPIYFDLFCCQFHLAEEALY